MDSDRSWEYGGSLSSAAYDRHVQNQAGQKKSVTNRMQQQYWVTKQAVMKKLGRKEDEFVVAGDAELDAKLEVFHAVQMSCMELLKVIEKYQDDICALAQDENAMGRFLKQMSSMDKTRAGKMMSAVGKAQTGSSDQRLALRGPLVRLYQEIETFRYRAISDTLMTINRMEGARMEYRAALMWMKDVSKELDPDTFKQLEKFRKVQTRVRTTKARFDQLKNDVCQKVDLLGASRCNLFSSTLASYQTNLLHYLDKSSRTLSAVQESFKGYQHYEFNMLKELSETSKQLAKLTGAKDLIPDLSKDQERKLNRQEEAVKRVSEEEAEEVEDDELIDLKETSKKLAEQTGSKQKAEVGKEVTEENVVEGGDAARRRLISLEEEKKPSLQANNSNGKLEDDLFSQSNTQSLYPLSEAEKERSAYLGLMGGEESADKTTSLDLLTEDSTQLLSNRNRDEIALMDEIMNMPTSMPMDDPGATPYLSSYFEGMEQPSTFDGESPESQMLRNFLPSDLLESTNMTGVMSMMQELSAGGATGKDIGGFLDAPLLSPQQTAPSLDVGSEQSLFAANPPPTPNENKQDSSKSQAFSKGAKPDMTTWFSLFADLDPLQNPDAVGKEKSEEVDDRNC